MPLYTNRQGVIPNSIPDDSPGWILVPDKPTPGEGEEVVWWFPPGWVVRPVKPPDEEGYKWKWMQSELKWFKANLISVPQIVETSTENDSDSISLDGYSASGTL